MWKRLRRWVDWILVAALACWGLSLTVNTRREQIPQSLIGRLLLSATTPAVKATDSLSDSLRGVVLSLFEGHRLRRENADLRETVTRLSLDLTYERDTNARLQRVGAGVEARRLGETHRLVLAEVIGRHGRRAIPGALLISRGSRDGVAEGQPVAHGDALIGVIRGNPTPGSAYVQMLVDPNSWVVGTLRISRVQGVVRGDSRRDTMEHLRFLPKSLAASLEEGSEIVSSGLSGLLFPGGLRIGTIERVEVNAFGERVGIVTPAADFSTIEEVVVLTPIKPPEDTPDAPPPPDKTTTKSDRKRTSDTTRKDTAPSTPTTPRIVDAGGQPPAAADAQSAMGARFHPPVQRPSTILP